MTDNLMDRFYRTVCNWRYFYTFICIPGPAETAGNADFFVPHSLALIESRDTICVADREHGRYM